MNPIATNSKSDTDDDKSYTEDTNSEKEESLSQNDTMLSCKICDKQFVQDSNLVRYIQNIHPNNGQKRKSHETMEQGEEKELLTITWNFFGKDACVSEGLN